MTDQIITVDGLSKTFRQGFWRKRVNALKGVSFNVERGQIFGFLGPNGAGKTTTIKILAGLIAPTAGVARIFGQRVPSSEVMKKVGFLPENPYVYQYLTAREFVVLCARLSGLGGDRLVKRVGVVLERTGVAYAADRQVRSLSKGMLQRACLAAALVAEPELLILDEPMSGLDPVGRKEVRDLILDERDHGRTVFFSSHILSDVESMCDQVTILRRGSVVVQGKIRELVCGEVLRTDVTLAGDERACNELGAELAVLDGVHSTREFSGLRVDIEGDARVNEVLRRAIERGLRVVEVMPRRETLEDLFVKRAIGPESVRGADLATPH